MTPIRCKTSPLVFVITAILVIYFLGVTTDWIEILLPSKPVTSNTLDLTYGIHRPVLTYLHRKHPDGKFMDVQTLQRQPVAQVVDHTDSSGVVLEVVPSTADNGGEVQVTWKGGVRQRSDGDWLGLYCPSNAEAVDYLDSWPVPKDSTSHGTAFHIVYNLRVNCEFRYYSTKSAGTELLARSGPLTFKGGPSAPLQGHLALTGDATQMRVQWTSGSRETPLVRYGRSPDTLDLVAEGITRTYHAADMCGPPANTSSAFVDPGYLHDVLLSSLVPSTRYYYQYGRHNQFSDVHSFLAAPEQGSKKPFSFITYGDMGLSPAPGSQKVATLISRDIKEGAAFVIHQGDLSYAVGYAYIWDQWMTLIEPIASKVPYMVGIGNHEQGHLVGGKNDPSHDRGEGFHPPWGNYGHDSGGECGVPVFYRFHMPETGHQPWWYSFEYGSLHVIMLSTEHDFTKGSEQYHWLQQDLKSVDRQRTPWLIVAGHRPMYCSEDYPTDYEVTLHMQHELEVLLHEYRVDLALWGHYHSYERTCPVYQQQCRPDGIVHVTVGSAGMFMTHKETYNVPWSAHFELSYGYGRVTIANSSALLWEYIRSLDESVSDTVWLHH